MDYEALSRALLRRLRGKRSQLAFSRRLGFSSNVVYPWEAGTRHPEASTFLRAAAGAGVNVREALARFSAEPRAWRTRRDATGFDAVMRLMRELRGNLTIGELASRLGRNRSTVSRWLKGKTEPRLPDLLAFVDVASLRLLDFVALFADPAGMPLTAAGYRELKQQRRIAYELPWSHAVLRALELSELGGSPEDQETFIAARLGVQLDIVQHCLQALMAASIVTKVGGRYRIARVLTVDTGTEAQRDRVLKRHWARVAVDRFEHAAPPSGALFSYNLFGISNADFERLRELQIRYFEEARSLIAMSEPTERVALINMQLLPLDGWR